MPTNNRREMIPAALQSYLSQTWEEKELIVLDDGTDELRDLFEGIPSVTYIRLAIPQSIGTKRNVCCEAARGEAIIHFDSDDWNHPERMADQVERLTASNQAVTGYGSILFYDVRTSKAYKFVAGRRDYALGTSLCYLRSFWRRCPFENKQIGEDNEFVRSARRMRHVGVLDPVSIVPGGQMIVARIHDGQTSPKPVDHAEFHEVSMSALPADFLACSA